MIRRRDALSLVELVLAIGILSLAAVSMYQIFSGGYRAVYRTRHASMAAQVARETLEELQQMTLRPSGGWLFRAAVHDPTGTTAPDAKLESLAAANLLRAWAAGSEVYGPVFHVSSAILNPEGLSVPGLAALKDLLDDPVLQYPTEYKRLHRRIEFANFPGEKDMLRARVSMTWEEEGKEREAPASAVFETLLVKENQAVVVK